MPHRRRQPKKAKQLKMRIKLGLPIFSENKSWIAVSLNSINRGNRYIQQQEPMSRSMQLHYIPVTAFSQTDLFLDGISSKLDSGSISGEKKTQLAEFLVIQKVVFSIHIWSNCLSKEPMPFSHNWLGKQNLKSKTEHGTCFLSIFKTQIEAPLWSLSRK